jgi:hypothetical protein
MLELHLFQVHFQLFGDQHRDRGIGSLTHFDVRHGQSDPAISSNAHEGIGREHLVGGCFGLGG